MIVCEPLREFEYLEGINKLLNPENFEIIDLNACLVDFVSNHKEELVELYDLLQSATHEIFKAPAGEESKDLFKTIISLIQNALKENKVPVLIHVGALYGTGIHNIHIMENEVVMNASLPLIILYPATVDHDQILFLGKYPASKYRCMIIQ